MKNRVCILISFVFLIYGLSVQASKLTENNVHPNVLHAFYPPIKRETPLWLNADLLCFVPKEKSIVLTNKETNLFTTANVTLEPDVKPNFKWDVGFRLGFGYIFPCRTWDMAINWTHFNTRLQQCRSTNGDIGLGMFPIWSLADDIIPYDWVSIAKMHWKLNINLFDLDFGRAVAWKDQFFLRPIMGLRFAAVNQNLDVRYGGGIFANGLNLPELDSTFGYDSIDMTNNFWGIGPRLGIDAQLNVAKGFRLYATTCGTCDYGFFKVHQKETYLKSLRYKRNCSPHGFRWMIDATAGVLWKSFCAKNRYALSFALGWEYHIFFDQMKLKGDQFGLVSHNRNLSLNGLSISARFDF